MPIGRCHWKSHWQGVRYPRITEPPQGHNSDKEMFLNHLYAGTDEPELKILDVFVAKLRKKIAQATGGKHYIETVWGRGYVLREPSDEAAKIPA